jgi:hypothetical protein
MKSTTLVLTAAGLLGLTASHLQAADWKPAKGPLATRWAAQVDPERVHPEYPRPQMVRPEWTSLNGLWDYTIQPKGADRPDSFQGQILVPFPVESSLSGVMKPVNPGQRLWYRRQFEAAPNAGSRWLLHFGAVDWETMVYVNGKKLGEHRGGYDPFTIDVTDALTKDGKQELVVGVWDPTDTGSQPRGKQVLKPGGIMYTANTGIWQSVWLEPVPETHIDRLKIVPDPDAGEVRVTVTVKGKGGDSTILLTVLDGDREIANAHGPASGPIVAKIPGPHLWSPDDPYLYNLRIAIKGGEEVRSYVGMRKIALGKDEAGINRLMLNGKPLFQLGPLDQGWWPDGLYTAPTEEALKYDIEITRKLGFNMIRKHVKVEPERWYYWCDTMGMLVWQDMPSGDNKDAESRKQFDVELERMIDALHNHPSIIMWVPFNEGWGQHDTPRHVEWIKNHDPTRLVNNASGWTDARVGDVSDMHNYPGPGMPPTERNRAAVLGEFGGLGLPLKGHLWLNRNNWGYRTYPDQGVLTDAYKELIRNLRDLEVMGLSAAVYTQTTDCEVEVNGLLTYDRAVIKMPVDEMARAHKALFGPLPTARTIVPTAQTEPQSWRLTTTRPEGDWASDDFDDSKWAQGKSGFGTKETPGAIVNTEWRSGDIWIRRTFQLDAVPRGSLRAFIHHDEDAEVYLNGKLVLKLSGYGLSYSLQALEPAAEKALKSGRNVLAVHCHQTAGGQYIDVGLVELMEHTNAATLDPRALEGDSFRVGMPPRSLGLSPFYEKYVSAGGFPIVGSVRVSDHAMMEAAYLVNRMLAYRPEIRDAMIRNHVRCAVMAYNERTTDIPEHRDLTPKTYWDVRARGLGATRTRPAVSCAEENLLGLRGDPYSTENILIHEFGHAMHEMGLSSVDPTFDRRLRQAFRDATKKGLWKGTYAATNPHEYWAEGVQSWFDTNRENDSQHNHVNTREELKEYDPGLAALVKEVFGDESWRYTRPEQRTDKGHLAGFDRQHAPRFAWEPELLETNRRLRRDGRRTDESAKGRAASERSSGK